MIAFASLLILLGGWFLIGSALPSGARAGAAVGWFLIVFAGSLLYRRAVEK